MATSIPHSSKPFRVFSYENHVYSVVNPSEVELLPGWRIIDPQNNLDTRDLRKAIWATNSCPEIAYMLKRFDTESTFLARLNVDHKKVPVVKYQSASVSGHMLSPEVQKAWFSLENTLTFISGKLLNAALNNPESKLPLDASYWPSPSEQGYRKVHKDEGSVRRAAAKSRDACALLAARCTMAIALVTTDPNTSPPQWLQVLQGEGVPPAWIDILRDSILTNLSPGLRIGAFINLVPGEDRTAWINHVSCMIHANLPVYIWWPDLRPDVIARTVAEYPFLAPYVPWDTPPYIVPESRNDQAPLRFRWPIVLESDVPLAESEEVIPRESEEVIPHGQRQLPGESCFDFFMRRDQLNAKKEPDEKPECRAARLARQQKAVKYARPTRPTAVFLWKEVGDVDATVPSWMLELDYRAYIGRSAIGELWQLYPNSQKLYDAWNDEWDICPKLAPEDEIEDPWDSYDRFQPPEYHPTREPVSALPTTSATQAFQNDLQLVHGADETEVEDWRPNAVWKIDDLCFFRYGLISEIAEGAGINYREYDVQTLQKIFGLMNTELDPHNEKTFLPLSALVTSLLHTPEQPSAPGLIWDLNPACDYALVNHSQRHPSIVVAQVTFNRTLYYHIRYLDDSESLDWALIVDDVTAVELCRQKNIRLTIDAVYYCVTRGTRVNTVFEPSPRDRKKLVLCPPMQVTLEWRERDFKPDYWDYKEYEHRVYAILSEP